MNRSIILSLLTFIILFTINENCLAVNKTTEPNKQSKEYFKIAIDTLQSASVENIEARKNIALKYLKKSINADNNNIQAYMWSVMILIDQKKYKLALTKIKSGIKSSKANNNILLPQLYISQGGLYLMMDKKNKAHSIYKLAISEFMNLLKNENCNDAAIANIPIIYAMIDEKSKAIKFIDNNKSCYSNIDLKQFKQMINDLNIDEYLNKMKEN